LEEIMSKSKIVVSFGALALGAALVSSPALAQSNGRAANDGGAIATPSGATSQPLYNSVPQAAPTAAQNGRAANDGGTINEPTAAQNAAAEKANQHSATQQKPNYGRALNDGGMVQ
jgi:hypothetical protein